MMRLRAHATIASVMAVTGGRIARTPTSPGEHAKQPYMPVCPYEPREWASQPPLPLPWAPIQGHRHAKPSARAPHANRISSAPRRAPQREPSSSGVRAGGAASAHHLSRCQALCRNRRHQRGCRGGAVAPPIRRGTSAPSPRLRVFWPQRLPRSTDRTPPCRTHCGSEE